MWGLFSLHFYCYHFCAAKDVNDWSINYCKYFCFFKCIFSRPIGYWPIKVICDNTLTCEVIAFKTGKYNPAPIQLTWSFIYCVPYLLSFHLSVSFSIFLDFPQSERSCFGQGQAPSQKTRQCPLSPTRCCLVRFPLWRGILNPNTQSKPRYTCSSAGERPLGDPSVVACNDNVTKERKEREHPSDNWLQSNLCKTWQTCYIKSAGFCFPIFVPIWEV